MKKLLIIALLIAGCKKSEVAPENNDPEPIPPTTTITPTPTCQTGKKMFVGKWKCNNAPYDTIEFIFKHNNCPKENSNTYVVNDFAEAMNTLLVTPISPNVEFEVESDEVYWLSYTKDKYYNFAIQIDSTLKLTGKNLKYGAIKFVKI